MSELASYVPHPVRGTGSEEPAPGRKEFHDFAAFLTTLWRRRRLVLAITFGLAVLVGAATVLTPKSYQTTVTLLAGNPSTSSTSSDAGTALPILNALVLRSGAQSAETFAELAQQESVARQVADSNHLNVSPQTLLDHITVKPVPNTAILNVTASWPNRRQSAVIANAFAQAFIGRERDFVKAQADEAIQFLSSEIPRAETRMRTTADELATFEASKGYVDAGTHTQDVITRMAALDAKSDALALDNREAQALLANATRQLADMPASVENAKQITTNPVVSDLRTRLSNVDVQLATARDQYTEQHPLVVSLKKQRADLIAEIARQPQAVQSGDTLAVNPVYQSLQQSIAEYKQRIDGDSAQLDVVRKQRAQLAPILRTLPRQSIEFATLQQRAKLASDVYNALEQKYNDATIAATTAISDVSVIQAAEADSAKVSPSLKTNIAVALVVGLALAIMTVFVLEIFDGSVRDASTARNLTGLPVLGRIPSLQNASPKALPWLQSMTVEAFLQLCIGLKLKSKRPLQVLAITSPCRGDGKSVVAFHLAKAMSKVTDSRVLLVDADLRRPTLHELAGTGNEAGLSDVLTRSRCLPEAVYEIAPRLDLLSARIGCDNPVALLDSAAYSEFLDAARGRYATIIVDTPALAPVPDALIISARSDGTVLVVSANTTSERDTSDVVAQLAAVGIDNLIGVVLNKDETRMSDYSDYFMKHAALE